MRLLDRFFGPPNRDNFAKMVMDAIHQEGEKRDIVFDQGQFVLSVADENGARLSLDNAYTEYCGAGQADQQKVLQK